MNKNGQCKQFNRGFLETVESLAIITYDGSNYPAASGEVNLNMLRNPSKPEF